jgi:ketosteroid isomerase-like protein
MSEAPDTEVTCALVLTRLFIEALDARDVEALAILVAPDAEFRKPAGGSLYGREAVERIVDAASTA